MFALIANLALAQVLKTVDVSTAGTLSTLLTDTEKSTVTNLTVTGTIKAADIFAIRDQVTKLAVLDLSGVTIAETTSILTKTTIYPANEMPKNSFYDGTKSKISLKTIVLPNSLKSIGNYAFYSCSMLMGTLTIPNSVTTIGDYAFYACTSLTGSLVIPASVSSIGNSAFYSCSALSGTLIIPNSVTTIGTAAFYTCNQLTGLNIGSSVTTIGGSAFAYCTGLTGTLLIPNSVTSIGYSAFYQCTGLTGDLILPKSITKIEESTFAYCKGLNGSLVLPDSLRTIGNSAFANCNGLTGNLIIPKKVNSIGNSAFAFCPKFIGALTLSDSLSTIGYSAFANCSSFTGSLIIPPAVTSIGDLSFSNCYGISGNLIIPSDVAYIGVCPFDACPITSFEVSALNANYSSVDAVLFDKNKTTLIEYPGAKQGFYKIPGSVSSINYIAFDNCKGLSGVSIPTSVNYIGSSAFQYCSGLASIYSYASIPVSIYFSSSVFYGVSKTNCTLYVPTGSKNAYQKSNQWLDFSNLVEFDPTDVVSIKSDGIQIYPTVILSCFRINGLTDNTSITINDIQGKRMLEAVVSANENISVSTLPKGYYVVLIKTLNGTVTRKLLKD